MPKRRKPNLRRRDQDPLLMVNARMVEHQKDRVHKMGSFVVLGVVLVGALFLVSAGADYAGRKLFSENQKFAIQTLTIESDGGLPSTHIKEWAGLAEGTNLFDIDLDEIREKLESIPIIKSAVLQRVLPDTLDVQVSQRVPIARLGSLRSRTSPPLTVDEEGVLMGPNSRMRYLPHITGFARSRLSPGQQVKDPSFHHALEVLRVCESADLQKNIRVQVIDISDPSHMGVRLVTGEEVFLPRRMIATKLHMLNKFIQKAASEGKGVESIDLTLDTNVPIVFRK